MKRHRHRWRRRLRRPFEWLGVGLGLAIMANLPRRALLGFCDVLARVMFTFDRRGRRMAAANLEVMFPGRLSPRRTKLIVLRSYRNMARSVGHAFWTFRKARRRVASAGEMSPACRQLLAAHRPVVTVSGHIGCWEILSQLAFLEGHRMVSVAKDIGSEGMTSLLMRSRRSIGQEIVRAEGAFRPLQQALRDGKSLGLLVDQRVSPRKGGLIVRFFGQPVAVSAAPAFFAAKAKVPVLVAWSRPLHDGRYRCEQVAFYASAEARDLWGLTQRCLQDLETVIRRHPSCWILAYRYFGRTLTAADLAKLEARERRA